jgi:hypothetical protein
MPEPQPAFEMPVPFGVDADTGRPLEEIDESTLRFFSDQGPDTSAEQAQLAAKVDESGQHFGVVGDADANDLAESGWAVMFSFGVDQKMREALQPLLDYRKSQVADERLFKVFEGPSGYQAGDTASKWLARQGVRVDVVDPSRGVPFYFLIVGPPDEIPFEFQYGLDIYWAVGRLWFPTPDEFRQYAASVIQYETMATVPASRQMAIFAPQHDFDRATQLFCKQVAKPLVSSDSTPQLGRKQKFAMQSFIGEPATKSGLNNVLTAAIPNGTPSLLFSGSHGMVIRPDDPRQGEKQGAIVCNDWGGYGSIGEEHWYAASDLPANAKVHGMIHVLFACYGSGCPQFDNFSRTEKSPKQIAPKAMLGRLPQALLAHPDGGALAVLGHVERAWAFSFQSERGGPQIQGFRDVLGRVLRGDRLGQATDQFNTRWAALSTELADLLNDMQFNVEVPPQKLANMWVARDDARNYIVFGDPAVRLRVDDMPVIA